MPNGRRAPSTHRHTPVSGAHVPDLFSRSWFRHETTRTRNGSFSRETAVSVARVKPLCQLVTVVSVGDRCVSWCQSNVRRFSLLITELTQPTCQGRNCVGCTQRRHPLLASQPASGSPQRGVMSRSLPRRWRVVAVHRIY